jgi:hypothetical protein
MLTDRSPHRAGGRINTEDFPGNAVVTIELELGVKSMQTVASEKSSVNMRQSGGSVRFAQPMQTLQRTPKRPFHGDNTGSNPVGDAI